MVTIFSSAYIVQFFQGSIGYKAEISLLHPDRGDVGRALMSPQYYKPSMPQDPFTLQVTFVSGSIVYGHLTTDGK